MPMERSAESNRSDDDTEGPGNITVDEPTQPALDPEDDDLQDGTGSDEDAS